MRHRHLLSTSQLSSLHAATVAGTRGDPTAVSVSGNPRAGGSTPNTGASRRHRSASPWTPGTRATPREVQDQLRAERTRILAAARRGPRLRAWAAATREQFALCGIGSTPLWHARFHPDVIIETDSSAVELTAMHALWLAAKARELCGADVACLRLTLTAQYPEIVDAVNLAASASGLLLTLETDSIHNPAVGCCESGALLDWRSTDLTALIEDRGSTP